MNGLIWRLIRKIQGKICGDCCWYGSWYLAHYQNEHGVCYTGYSTKLVRTLALSKYDSMCHNPKCIRKNATVMFLGKYLNPSNGGCKYWKHRTEKPDFIKRTDI